MKLSPSILGLVSSILPLTSLHTNVYTHVPLHSVDAVPPLDHPGDLRVTTNRCTVEAVSQEVVLWSLLASSIVVGG